MNILNVLKQLRDDIKAWVTNNLNALNAKIDEKTIPIDNELDSNSTNPVQNKVITNAINNIPKFSGDYNDLTNAPNITEDGSGNMVITDESGNIIFKADVDGMHTTALSLNGEAAATEAYVDEAISNIDIPDTDLSDYYTKTETDTAIESAKEELSESIVSESEEWHIADKEGNVIASVDASGLTTTAVSVQNVILDGNDIIDVIRAESQSGASIIDVIALPTSNIDTNATYRLLNGTFVLNKMLGYNSTCHLVEWNSDPTEPGEPVLVEDTSTGVPVMRINGYYNTRNNTVYGYFDSNSIETIESYIDYLVDEGSLNSIAAAALKLALGTITPGWKTMEQILNLIGTTLSLKWGGVITSTNEIAEPDELYLYLHSNLFAYRNNKWVSTNAGIGMPGAGAGAEIFNSPDNLAYGIASHAEGTYNEASGDRAHAEGYGNLASGNSSHAEGDGNQASGNNSHAEGESNHANGQNAHAEGALTWATGPHSHTEGYKTKATASAAHAGGIGTIASGEGQTAIGRYNQEDASKAFIIGNGGAYTSPGLGGSTNVFETRQNAMSVDWAGNAVFAGDVTAKGSKLATESYVNTQVSGVTTDITNIKNTYAPKAYVDDSYTTAGKKAETVLGIKSTAEGFDNTVTGSYSHAEGWNNTVKSNFSHAEGVSVYIEEGADAAHGEGIDIVVEGLYSHAEGYMTSVFGAMAHGEGVGNTVYGDAQHVQGSFSIDDEEGKYLHIVGNGQGIDARSNAHTIDWDGNAWFQGDIKVGGESYGDENAQTVATQEYLLNIITNLCNKLAENNITITPEDLLQ